MSYDNPSYSGTLRGNQTRVGLFCRGGRINSEVGSYKHEQHRTQDVMVDTGQDEVLEKSLRKRLEEGQR